MPNDTNPTIISKPSFVTDLEITFGPPSQQAFGSSVFYNPQNMPNLEEEAMLHYRYFLGDTWEKLGEANWLSTWGVVYERNLSSPPDIIQELKTIPDRGVRMSAGLLLENQEDAAAAQTALRGAFDQSAIRELKIYRIGDGAAMSGLLIVANIHEKGCLSLILLLD